MAITTTQMGIQKVFIVRGYDVTTGELKFELRNLKESTFTNGQTTVYLTGGRSNAQIDAFDHSKTAMISGSSAKIVQGLIEAQTGNETLELTNTTEIEYSETVEISSDTATTTYTATGTAGSEVGFVYILDASGSPVTTLFQAGTVSATEFTYTSGTRTLTFNTSDYADGTKAKVVYKPTVASAKQFTSKTTTFSETLKIVADALLKDSCTKQQIQGQIVIPYGKISGEFEWSLASDADPAVHNFEVTCLEDCVDEKLWDFYIFDSSDIQV